MPSIGNLLVAMGRISPEQLQSSLEEQALTRERIGEILCRRGLVTQEALLESLASQRGVRLFDPARDALDPESMELVPIEFARRHDLLAVHADETTLRVAVADPLDLEAMDHLKRLAAGRGRRLEILLGAAEVLRTAREAAYARLEGTRDVGRLIDRVAGEAAESAPAEEDDREEAQRRAEDAGVIRLVDQILAQALQDRATDIHIEPQEKGLLIRYRVDGILHEALRPPRAVYTGVVSRIKILADMDIAERRAPQDGRFTHRMPGREVDVRVSSIPAIHGEKMVLRLLDKSGFSFSLRDLGFSEREYRLFLEAIRRPFGMTLLSGPTGSGKSTTLYAGLLELRSAEVNITTVEDPVEYQIAGINQVQVNERKRLTFATALRYFLRQDPDVIMVGEVRDADTASLAVRAALTGHMVFSTIHANDAPATATRLISMGIEPFMAASALTVVAAQRLVRRTCPHCREEYRPAEETLLALRVDPAEPGAYLRGSGCVLCRGHGYCGRVAVTEMMPVTPGIRELIAEGRTAAEIRRRAVAEGMKSLKESGMEKVRAGVTTAEEVLRVCLGDD